MMLNSDLKGRTYNLTGKAISQPELVGYLNKAFGTGLYYEDMSPEAYLEMQVKVNGEMLGPIVAGIYRKVRIGELNVRSEFREVTGRDHISWEEYFAGLKK